MATIPLPALHVEGAPQQPGILQQYAQMMGIQNMQQERQLRGQQIQAAGLENQQRQIAVQDQQKLRDLYVKHQGNLDDVIKEAPSAGVSPQSVNALQLHNTDVKSKLADVDAKTLANEQAKADLYQGAYDAVSKAPAEQKQQVYQQQIQALAQRGLDVSKMPPQYPGDEQFAVIGAGVKGHKQMVEDALKASEQQKNTAQASEATAQTNKINTEINPANPADQNIQKQKYQGILQRIQAGGISAVSPQEMQWAKAHEASERKTTTQSDSLGVTSSSTSGPAGLSAVGANKGGAAAPGATGGTGSAPSSPAKLKESYADMIGTYKLNPTMLQRMIVKHPDVLAQVQQKYPDWDQTEYNAKNKLMSDYTSGKGAQQINAVNTALGHAGVLGDAVDALKNGNIPVLNKIANAIGVQIGETPATTLTTIVHRVGPELAAAYIAGGGSAGERGTTEADFDVSKGNDQLKANLAITAQLLRSKIGSLENQYKNTVKRDDFQQRFITPEAQKSLDRFSPQKSSQAAGSGHVIQIGDKKYQYKGAGSTADLSNYSELPK